MHEYRKKGSSASARVCADAARKDASRDMVEAAYRIIRGEDAGRCDIPEKRGKGRFFVPFALGFVSSALVCAALLFVCVL